MSHELSCGEESCDLHVRDHVSSCDLQYVCSHFSVYFSYAGVRVAFQQAVYPVREGNGSVAVCVEISVLELHIDLAFDLFATFDGSTIFSGRHDSVCYIGS